MYEAEESCQRRRSRRDYLIGRRMLFAPVLLSGSIVLVVWRLYRSCGLVDLSAALVFGFCRSPHRVLFFALLSGKSRWQRSVLFQGGQVGPARRRFIDPGHRFACMRASGSRAGRWERQKRNQGGKPRKKESQAGCGKHWGSRSSPKGMCFVVIGSGLLFLFSCPPGQPLACPGSSQSWEPIVNGFLWSLMLSGHRFSQFRELPRGSFILLGLVAGRARRTDVHSKKIG